MSSKRRYQFEEMQNAKHKSGEFTVCFFLGSCFLFSFLRLSWFVSFFFLAIFITNFKLSLASGQILSAFPHNKHNGRKLKEKNIKVTIGNRHNQHDQWGNHNCGPDSDSDSNFDSNLDSGSDHTKIFWLIACRQSQAVSQSNFDMQMPHELCDRYTQATTMRTDSGTVGQTPVNRACLNGWLIRRVNVYLALLIEFLPRWSINSSSNCSSTSSSGNRSSNSCNQVWRLYCSVTRSWQGGASSKRSQLAFNTHIWKSFAQKQWVCCVCQCRSRHALRG